MTEFEKSYWAGMVRHAYGQTGQLRFTDVDGNVVEGWTAENYAELGFERDEIKKFVAATVQPVKKES